MAEKQLSQAWSNRRLFLESMEREQEQHLTFKPKTNHSARRKLVDRIMREHSRQTSAHTSRAASEVRMPHMEYRHHLN